jgi:large subunit ribosomal protein L25
LQPTSIGPAAWTEEFEMRMNIAVPAQVRETRGKNEARRLRKQGLAPAIVYGSGENAVALAVDPKQIVKILHSSGGHNTIFDLDLQDGKKTPVMIVDWQFEPTKETLLHVDLKRIDLTKRVRVFVPIQAQGEPKGVKQQGGLLEVVRREIEIECLPDDIPEHFIIDVGELLIGQSVRAADAPLTGSMRLLGPADTLIAHVVALRVQEAAPAEAPAVEPAAATAAEPEVIKRGRKEEEQ